MWRRSPLQVARGRPGVKRFLPRGTAITDYLRRPCVLLREAVNRMEVWEGGGPYLQKPV